MTAKRHPPRRPLETVPRERSAYAHDVARCGCGGLLTFAVEPITGAVATRCPGCGRAAPVARVPAMRRRRLLASRAVRVGRCVDCGAELRQIGTGRTRQRCEPCAQAKERGDNARASREREARRRARECAA